MTCFWPINEITIMSAEIATIKAWVAGLIVKYNVCPFARPALAADAIRYVLASDSSLEQVLAQLVEECQWLDQHPETATTLLILPRGFADFYTYLDALDVANELLAIEGYEGVYQLASFHPEYCFADSLATDPANYTNRAPYPILHLLREADVSQAVDSGDSAAIVARNIDFAQRKGSAFFVELLAAFSAPANNQERS
jgi:uncharacterized protein